MLCVNEIFLYLDENLKLTPQAMSDKATPIDELEDMHHRVCVDIPTGHFYFSLATKLNNEFDILFLFDNVNTLIIV